MDRPAPDPEKLLQAWMEWERGEATPGRAMANMKTGGMRELLEGLAERARPASEAAGTSGAAMQAGPEAAGETWVPLV